MIQKELRKYILPNILAMLGLSCYILVDTIFISAAAGTNGITALNLALPVYGLIFAIGSMIGTGSATKYAIEKALGNKNANDYFLNSIVFTIIASVFFVLTGLFATGLVLQIMGADEVIKETGFTYMRIVLLFAPVFMLNYSFTAFVRNDNAPKTAMAATLTSSFFNIVFDYIFMFPMKMGMPGAALATALSPAVSILVCSTHFFSKKNTIHVRVKLPSLRMFFSSVKLGVAGFVGEISGAVTCMVFNYLLLRLGGNIAVAAYGVIANVSLVGIAIFNGISQGLQPLASRAAGQKRESDKKTILWYSTITALILATVTVIIIFAINDRIVGVFNSEKSQEMAKLAGLGLKIYSIGFIFAGMNIVKAGFFGATGLAKECSIVSVSRGIVAIIGFAIVLSFVFGITGVWLAFPVAEMFTFIISLFLGKSKDAGGR